MDSTVMLTGMLPFVVLVAAVLTALTSAFFLWLYRRATLRAMERYAGAEGPPLTQEEKRGAVAKNSTPLTIKSWQDDMPVTSADAETAYRRAAHSLRSAAMVYAAGGLAYALILAMAWMIAAGADYSLGRFLWLLTCYAWPTVFAFNIIAVMDRRVSLLATCSYFAIVAVIALYVLVRSPNVSTGQLVFLWFFANAPGTVLLLTFFHRRVRSVGPLVLAFMVVGVTGAFLAVEVVRNNEGLLGGIVSIGDAVGLGATALFVLMLAAGFAVFGLLGWWLLGRIGRFYRAKRLSDQSLTLDSLWLLFGVVQSFTLVFEGWGWIFTGLVAFAAYKAVTRVGFALLRKRASSDLRSPMLLLLRVFALGRRSEQFFGTFSKLWRRSGSISLIAGPDLLTAVVEPHEFLDFVSGRLSRQFVQDEADLKQRLTVLDRQPDPDGRYRVNEFFCHADTWRMTMRQLAKDSDAVLMDLRSFSHANHGCLYELAQLLDIVDLERVLFLVDETTDRQFLQEKLQ
ncbi:MAG: hypothetical protein ACFFC7_27100, partial [Candidatus Hermodarchaeota archaeon]